MENVMRNAWAIAYEGVEKFGGKVKEYFAEALKIAWSLFKKGGKEMDYTKQVKGTIAPIVWAELEGSEKQIVWAKDIRKKAASILLNDEILRERYEMGGMLPGQKPQTQSKSVKGLVVALQSEEGIKSYFEKMKENGVHESRYAATVKSMNAALDRYERFEEIMANTSAKFWIDNRDNQEKNYMFKAFKEYVATGNKKF